MVAFPQRGRCLCGDIEYSLGEDPLTLYACHCTDCQRGTGSSFSLSMIVRREALEIVRGQPEQFSVEMDDGRIKGAHFCSRCITPLWGESSVTGLAVLDPGTLDDTSWLRPVGHIWTRSAQPWVSIPEGALSFSEQANEEDYLALVRAWKTREAME